MVGTTVEVGVRLVLEGGKNRRRAKCAFRTQERLSFQKVI